MNLRIALFVVCFGALAPSAAARTVYRCVANGTVSLATAPEPGSRCVAHDVDDNAAMLPNLWGSLGVVRGKLYRREQDGRTVYSTRELPGSIAVQVFAVATPASEPAHAGLGAVGKPQVKAYADLFRRAAKRHRIDEAWLRAIAHAESAFDARAVSPKGALGVMQLMPETAAMYNVSDPHAASESIDAGARHLRDLLRRYDDDHTLAVAAYNAGVAAVARYGGIPPYAETQAYVAKVDELWARYKAVLQEQAPRR